MKPEPMSASVAFYLFGALLELSIVSDTDGPVAFWTYADDLLRGVEIGQA